MATEAPVVPARGDLHDRFHDSAGPLYAPGIHVIYGFKVVHVTDNYRVDIGDCDFTVLQGPGYGFVNHLPLVNIGPVTFMVGLSCSDYSYVSSHA